MKALLLIVLISCSSSPKLKPVKDSYSEKRNNELLEDFDVEKKILKKFEVKEEVKAEKPKVQLSEKEKTFTKVKKSSPIRTEKKVAKPKAISPKSLYPEDYPEKLRDFDNKSAKFWNSYKPIFFVGEEIVLDVFYLGVSTGTITIKTKEESVLGSEKVYHFHAQVETADFYSYLYEVNDITDTYVSKTTHSPLKFSLIQRQSSQMIDALQLFDVEKLKVFSLYKRETKDKKKKKKREKHIPIRYQDPFSVFYYLRGLPLKMKDHYEIPLVNKGDVELLVADVVKRESIKTKIGKKAAIKLAVETKHKGKTIKGGKMFFWYSDDSERVLLKFEADTKIGKVNGKIQKYSR